MNIISHMFSGVIILKILNYLSPMDYQFTETMILLSMFFSVLPDLEGLWSKKHMEEHHQTPFHTVLLWVTISFVFLIISFLTEKITIHLVSIFLMMTLAHLGFDLIFSRFSGVPVLEPYTKKQYKLSKKPAKHGRINPRHIHKKEYKKMVKNYFENKYLIALEVSIWVIGTIFLIF